MLYRDIFLIFFNMKVCCVFSLESPHRGDSNEYTQYTIFNMNEHPKLSQICCYGLFFKGLKNEFETAVVNEPSVFEPLKFYCTLYKLRTFMPLRSTREAFCFRSDQSSCFMSMSVCSIVLLNEICIWFKRR